MKMVKKILLGMVAVAAVLSFAGCKMGAGEGDTSGNKWDLTMTIDATANASKPLATENVYRRFWKKFSSTEKVAEIKTTITIKDSDIVYPETGAPACVVGYIFDLNKNTTDSSKVDFNLLGINPKTKKFYVERYTGITKGDKEEYDVPQSQSSLGPSVDIGYGSYARSDIDTWCSLTNQMYTAADGVTTIVVTIKQENKVYSVYLGEVKVGEYNAAGSTYRETIKDKEYAVGGIACYGNAGRNVKIIANYKSEKDSVTGKLEAEEIAE